MVLDGTTRAIATEAWSQLVHSILTNSPPRDMSREYYYTSPERGFNYLQKQLKRLERYKYKLGTENIQTRMRSDMLSVQEDEHINQQGIEHIRDCAKSGKHFQVRQANEDENQQGIEHIRYCLISTKHAEVVQTNEDENPLGIDHIRECIRSSKHSELMRANVDENEQKNEHIRDSPKSVLHSQVVQPYEYEQGIEHIQYCLISSKHSEVVQTNEDENQQDIGHIRDCLRSSKHYKVVRANEDEDYRGMNHVQHSSRFLMDFEYVLANEHEIQQGIEHILDCPGSTRHSQVMQVDDRTRSSKDSEVVQEDEDGNLHGIKYIRECPRSNKVSEVVQTNRDENQHKIEHIQDTLRPKMHSELEQAKGHGNHIKHIRESIKSTVSFKPAEFDERELISKFRQTVGSTEFPEDVHQQRINYKEARKMSTLFDELLDLIENGDLLREEKPTLRFQVLKVIKLLHHYGVDIIRRGVENELEDANLNSGEIEEDMAIYYKKKGLEVMLRICSTETCQRTIYDIIGKAERHQVFFI